MTDLRVTGKYKKLWFHSQQLYNSSLHFTILASAGKPLSSPNISYKCLNDLSFLFTLAAELWSGSRHVFQHIAGIVPGFYICFF